MSVARKIEPGPERLSPGVELADALAAYWAGQAILRLRREAAWLRREPAGDPAQHAFDLVRHDQARRAFFAADPTAHWLGERIAAPPPHCDSAFARMVERGGMSGAEAFVLGLALAAATDGALGPVLALCQADAARPWPTMALAQTLWDEPLAVLDTLDPARPLASFGLLADPPRTLTDPLAINPRLARLFGSGSAFVGLPHIAPDAAREPPAALAAHFAAPPAALELVALIGPAARDAQGYLAGLTARGGRPILTAATTGVESLPLAWLRDADLLLGPPLAAREDVTELGRRLAAHAPLPLRVFLHLTDRDLAAAIPAALLGPVLFVPPTAPAHRAELLRAGLGTRARGCDAGVERAAREHRLEPSEIGRVAAGLAALAKPPDEAALLAACRAECDVDFHGLAEPLTPRFRLDDVILPPAAERHLQEAAAAIRASAAVQHDWGNAEAFGEAGIALLFAGPPGAGKTMASQAFAREFDLPLYRIDLSQIVNKYIGETEKNLKRVFDAAEKFRCILLFDEAEALFGKRTEVRDANDRFANVETGYLLQRIESFTGVAILATNRRKDLDEAFARRLRYIVEFPTPGEAERRRIWEGVFPPGADLAELDLEFLARNFALSGGHIRSIALNASLQCAGREKGHKVTMRDALIATRRELAKLGRATGPEAFGQWYAEIEELRR